MDINITSIITWLLTAAFGAVSVFFSVRYGLQALQQKVDQMDKNIESDLKEIKVSVASLQTNQVETSKTIALHEYRLNNLENRAEKLLHKIAE